MKIKKGEKRKWLAKEGNCSWARHQCKVVRWCCALIFLLFFSSAIVAAEDLEEFDGLIEPDITVELASPVPGVLEAIDVDRGDVVKQGQVIAQLESSVERARLLLAKARSELNGEVGSRQAAAELARRKLQRTRELYAKKVVPDGDRDQAESDARVSEEEVKVANERKQVAGLELQLATAELNQRQIKSPISGVVTDRYSSAGSYVDTKPILRIAKIDPLRVEVIIPVTYFGKIKVGMTAKIEPELPLDKPIVAKVDRVDKVLDAASGTFLVRLNLPNPDHRLPSGLKCKVIFDSLTTKPESVTAK